LRGGGPSIFDGRGHAGIRFSRLQLAQAEIDEVLGDGYAARHPEVVSAVMISAALDWAAMTIAAALVAEDEQIQNSPGIVRAHSLVRP
jgi:hypothetical protein